MAGELVVLVLVLVLMALLFRASRRARPGGRGSNTDVYGGDDGTAYVGVDGPSPGHAGHAHGPSGAHDHAPGPGGHDGGSGSHGGDGGGGGHGDGDGGGAGGDGGGGGGHG